MIPNLSSNLLDYMYSWITYTSELQPTEPDIQFITTNYNLENSDNVSF